MPSTLDFTSVLHIGDPAFTASLLARAAKSSGRNWHVQTLAKAPRDAGWLRPVHQLARGAGWEFELARNRRRYDRVHLHAALAYRQISWTVKDFALHLHGTDIRQRQYEKPHRNKILAATHRARVVFYSTPDLADHISPHRTDARLVPVPVPTAPTSGINPLPDPTAPYVFFVPRWEEAKGGSHQVELARRLCAALPQDVRLIGIDWGAASHEARKVGVELVPRQPHENFRALIRDSRVCVGQLTGLMGASELDALAANVPLVVPLNPQWYDGSHPSLGEAPVLGGTSVAQTDVEKLVELTLEGLDREPTETAHWIEAHHSPEVALANVLEGYRSADW